MEHSSTSRRSHGRTLASITAVLAVLFATLAVSMSDLARDGAVDLGAIPASHAAPAPAPPTDRGAQRDATIVPTTSSWSPDRSSDGTSPIDAH